MNKKAINLLIVTSTLTIIIFNTILFYTLNCSGGIIKSKNVYGEVFSAESEDIDKINEIIKTLPTDINLAITRTQNKIDELNGIYADYITEENSNQNISTDEILNQIRIYQSVLEQLNHVSDYPDYIERIRDNASSLSDLSLYSEDKWHNNNIIKTQKDFYGLSNITLTIASEVGFLTLINYKVTDLFALLLTCIAIFSLCISDKQLQAERKRGFLPVIFWTFGIILMYLCNYILAEKFIGLPEFGTSVQSLPAFKSCPYLISCGSFITLCSLFKLVGFIIILCTVMAVFYSVRRLPIALTASLIFLIETIASRYTGENPIPVLLREINLLSAFSFERFYIRYLNLNVFSQAVSRLPIFIVLITILTIVMVIVVRSRHTAFTNKMTTEIERQYFDEIDHRYNETQKIHHDINNHLLVLGTLIKNGENEKAKTYLNQISEEMSLTIMPVKTGSSILDALLYNKTQKAKEYGAEINFEINCPFTGCNISDYDLCGIFGNILDNAIEAVNKCENNKTIKIFVGEQLGMIYISCQNHYNGELKRRGDKILTTKGNTITHGYGITRVREIADKHNGEVNITAENKTFLIEILLNKN